MAMTLARVVTGVTLVSIGLSACASAAIEPDGSSIDALVGSPDGAADAPVEDPADAAVDGAVDALVEPDAQTTSATWRDDTAIDFGAVGAKVTEAVIETRGSITAVAYYTGGLLVRGSDTGVMGVAAGMTWENVQAFAATGRFAIARSTTTFFGDDTPAGVGLSNGNDWTLWAEGEIWLDAGTWTFELFADDHGFVELVPRATGMFTRVVSHDWPDTARTGTFTATATGWYPIRYAFGDQGGGADLQLRYSGPGVAALTAIPRHRLRARVDHLRGWVQTGFDDSHLVGDVEHTIDSVGPGNTNWGSATPADLGLSSGETFSVRWAGQLRLDVAGTYTFRLQSDDGQRLWIDGVRLLDAWDDTTHEQVTQPMDLAAGWHDVVVDISDNTGSSIAVLKVETGPELAGQVVPVDRMRPVEARTERFEAAVNHTTVAIPDLGTEFRTVAVPAPVGAVVRGIDVGYTFSHGARGDLEIRLVAPTGEEVLLRPRSESGSGQVTQRLYTAGLDGRAVNGVWTLRATDLQASATGTLESFELTVHHQGGEPPIPTLATYDSPIRDLGAVVAIDRVSWQERVPAGADIQVRVRTGATAAACAAATWSAPVTAASGAAPAVTPAPFVQYRVELLSTGDAAASLDALQLDYRTQLGDGSP